MKVHSVVRKLHCASFEFLGQFVSFSVALSLCCHIWSRRTKQNILQDKYFLIIFVLFILAVIMNSYCIWTVVKVRRKHLSQMVKQGWLILQVGLLWTFIWNQVCSVYYHHAYIIEMWKVTFLGSVLYNSLSCGSWSRSSSYRYFFHDVMCDLDGKYYSCFNYYYCGYFILNNFSCILQVLSALQHFVLPLQCSTRFSYCFIWDLFSWYVH